MTHRCGARPPRRPSEGASAAGSCTQHTARVDVVPQDPALRALGMERGCRVAAPSAVAPAGGPSALSEAARPSPTALEARAQARPRAPRSTCAPILRGPGSPSRAVASQGSPERPWRGFAGSLPTSTAPLGNRYPTGRSEGVVITVLVGPTVRGGCPEDRGLPGNRGRTVERRRGTPSNPRGKFGEGSTSSPRSSRAWGMPGTTVRSSTRVPQTSHGPIGSWSGSNPCGWRHLRSHGRRFSTSRPRPC